MREKPIKVAECRKFNETDYAATAAVWPSGNRNMKLRRRAKDEVGVS
jgi:hypothetical protein